MIVAIDRNNNRVHAEDAISREDYFCGVCGKPVSFKNCTIKIKHFAHMPSKPCIDSWNSSEKNKSYDMSEWHYEWQMKYPKENREIVLTNGDISHKADIIVNNTVVEFQHSNISSTHFQERTNFYMNLEYEVVWLFDFMKEFENGNIEEHNGTFQWKTTKRTFKDLTSSRSNVHIFFQIGEDKIVRVTELNEEWFRLFKGTSSYTKESFLKFTGLKDGICAIPYTSSAFELSSELESFIEKYDVKLDKQQLRAVQAIDGANLLLAIPGSGKTTTLTYRLGYMALVRGIKPESVLAITFTTSAKKEMEMRLKKYFANDIKGEFDIRTLNSLGLMIVNQVSKGKYTTASDSEINNIIINSLKKRKLDYSIDNIKYYRSAIDYVKSKIDKESAKKEALKSPDIDSRFVEIYEEYNRDLRKKGLIDFNDQNNGALYYLQKNSKLLEEYQEKYKYICVDEAQDTSEVQHEIIKLLAGRSGNVFMVGDEDQSIYGFSGAYPEALLNFRDEYDNPFILRLKTNYRSTKEIVDASKKFIGKNTKRFSKEMIAIRGSGVPIKRVFAEDIAEQAKYICNEVKNTGEQIAVLYRDNISALPIVNELDLQGISYSLKNDIEIFETSKVKKILAMLSIAVNPRDCTAILKINRSIHKKLGEYPVKHAIYKVQSGQSNNIVEAVIEEVKKNNDPKYKNLNESIIFKLEDFKTMLELIRDASVEKGITSVIGYLYQGTAFFKLKEILLSLTGDCKSLEEYLSHVNDLKQKIVKRDSENVKVVLSTFHSSKGQEYDNVYLVDVYDGVCPNVRKEENFKAYEEERRLFYVAMTRAKNELCVLKRLDEICSFGDEVVKEPIVTYYIKCVLKDTGEEIACKSGSAKLGGLVKIVDEKIPGYVCVESDDDVRILDYGCEISRRYVKQKVKINYFDSDGILIFETTTFPERQGMILLDKLFLSNNKQGCDFYKDSELKQQYYGNILEYDDVFVEEVLEFNVFVKYW